MSLHGGEERDGECHGFVLHNDEELLLERVQLRSRRGMHHSDWKILPEDGNRDLEGAAPCVAFGEGSEHGSDGMVAFSQSTQSLEEEQSFGEGAALPIPPHSLIYAAYHMLNASDETLRIGVEATLHFAHPDTVRTRLAMGGGLMGILALPPRERSFFYTECRFGEQRTLQGHFVLPHYHEYGQGLVLQRLGGERGGEILWEQRGSIGEALGQRLSPPVSFDGADGFRFGCAYENTTDRVLVAGNGGNEMCNFFMHTDAERAWYAVSHPSFGGSRIVDHGKDAEGVHRFEVTDCAILEGE